MLDHVLIEVVSAIKDSCEDAMLEAAELDEHLSHDVWLGDVSYSASYALPGESDPPRVRADINLEWSTWSQSSYRTWWMGDGLSESPKVGITISFRLQGPKVAKSFGELGSAFPLEAGVGDGLDFALSGFRSESFSESPSGPYSNAIEVSYKTQLVLHEGLLANPLEIRSRLGPIGLWLASSLVILSDP